MSTPVATVSSRPARPGEMAAAFSPDPQRAYRDVTIRTAQLTDGRPPQFGQPQTALGRLGAADPGAINAAKISKYVGWSAVVVWGGVALLGGFFAWRLLGSPMPKKKEG